MPTRVEWLVRGVAGLEGAPVAVAYAVDECGLRRLAGDGIPGDVERRLTGWAREWHPGLEFSPLPAGIVLGPTVKDDRLNGLLVAHWPSGHVPPAASDAVEALVQLWADGEKHEDALTGLVGRDVLTDHLLLAGHAAGRSGAMPVLFFCDIDNMKLVNDRHGHQIGDHVLKGAADRLMSTVRPEDTVARVGGDEFVVLCPGVTDPAEAIVIASRLQTVLAVDHLVGSVPIHAPASIGVAIGPFASPTEGLEQADAAMYKAKRTRSGYAVYDAQLHRDVRWRLSVGADFPRAIQEGQLRLHYQPEYDVNTGRVVAFEALLRWAHPQRGLLGPQEFLDAASIGHTSDGLLPWVLRTACTEAATWPGRWPGMPPPVVAVNVSPHDLADGNLPEMVIEALTTAGLPGWRLQLEVTENTVLIDPLDASRQLRDVNQLGVSVALDDFGTGFSALALLRDLPVHVLKIDRSFTAELRRGSRATAIVSAVVRLGHHLKARICGEGVETQQQLHHLRRLGCDDAQGFLLHPPAPPADLLPQLLGPTAEGSGSG
ncbi:MAG TPA: bifunctional diguanylate cyclase/phosphodiesterase [Kineosporiaceae bacterium]|nr:bifunctional diguanylate cyclase/phosphodiesterase [Kineosporiaceae bacterium]